MIYKALANVLTNPAVWSPPADIVQDSRPSCTEGSVAQVGARPTDEKRNMCVSRAESSWADVGDEAESPKFGSKKGGMSNDG